MTWEALISAVLQPDQRAGGGGDAPHVPHLLLQPPDLPHRPRRGLPRRQRCLPPHTLRLQVRPVTDVWQYLGANTTASSRKFAEKATILAYSDC